MTETNIILPDYKENSNANEGVKVICPKCKLNNYEITANKSLVYLECNTCHSIVLIYSSVSLCSDVVKSKLQGFDPSLSLVLAPPYEEVRKELLSNQPKYPTIDLDERDKRFRQTLN